MGNCKIGKDSLFDSGTRGRVYCVSTLNFREGVTVARNVFICADPCTSIICGNDCMFSFDVILQSNDGHSLFDILSGENINCASEIMGYKNIIIGNHVWIGVRSMILGRSSIGD